jgi:DNA helicase-2/ATP-dependent DNA helicase PcrA
VLTHTNAGVVALRNRLDKASVPARAYRLSTVDGWAMRLITTFPQRSGHDPAILNLAGRNDYPSIREAAYNLLRAGHINDILAASYAHLVVDEYQDCSIRQHAVVYYAAQTLPTCVLGDPMQAIFGFGSDGLAHWDNHVCTHFPLAGELTTPWRWINAQSEPLGRWLLDVRGKLIRGEPIDLLSAPAGVKWVQLDGKTDHQRHLEAGRVQAPTSDGHVLIIGESTNPGSQRLFASQTPGAITVEAVDLRDLVTFARNLDLTAANALEPVLDFAGSMMTNVGPQELLRRVASLTRGTARKEANAVENAALSFVQAPTHRTTAQLLEAIGAESGVRTYRPAVVRACMKALQLCAANDGMSFADAAVRMREQNRLLGRPLPRRAAPSAVRSF